MNQSSDNVSDPMAPQPKEPHNPFEAIKQNITNESHDKETDDEMKRPKEDRSPLT